MNTAQAFQLFRTCRSTAPARGVTRTAAVAARRRAATAGIRYYSDDKSSTAETSEAKAEGKGEEGAASASSGGSECEEKLKKKEAEVVDLTVRCPASSNRTALMTHRVHSESVTVSSSRLPQPSA